MRCWLALSATSSRMRLDGLILQEERPNCWYDGTLQVAVLLANELSLEGMPAEACHTPRHLIVFPLYIATFSYLHTTARALPADGTDLGVPRHTTTSGAAALTSQ